MNMDAFAAENRARCEASNGFNHALGSWSLSDWMTATVGELGEAANIAKKLNRVRDRIPGNSESAEALRAALADEIADTFIYLDLLAQSQGIILSEAVRRKFDRTSEKIGYAPAARDAARAAQPDVLGEIAAERGRQMVVEGWSPAACCARMRAGACCVTPAGLRALADAMEAGRVKDGIDAWAEMKKAKAHV